MLMTTDPGDLVWTRPAVLGRPPAWRSSGAALDHDRYIRVALALARQRIMGVASSPTINLGATPAEGDIRKGFVYKRVPHVTLKSIANNPDIKPGMSRAEIDAAIARHAESEILYDQPEEDTAKVRVSGPFTVESLSPHSTVTPVRSESEKTATDGGRVGF